jgi:hypothetical protein
MSAYNDSFVFSLGVHTYENQKIIWPHLANPGIQKPVGYDEWKQEHPKPKVVQTHPSTLTPHEAVRAYEGIAFAMAQHGVVMNAHITINWRQMGVDDASKAVALLGEFNGEAAKWLRVGKPDGLPERASRRQGYGTDYFYVFVHENVGEQGFHTHLLCFIPAALTADFTKWSRACFARLLHRKEIPARAFWPVVRHQKLETDRVERCWAWFRYLIKQLDETVTVLDDEGALQPLRGILKPRPLRQMKPLPVPSAVRVSHNLGPRERRKAGFRSRFQTGDWERIFSGDELDERRVRLREEAQEAEFKAFLATLNY